MEFVSVCCKCQGFRPVIPSQTKRKLCDKKRSVVPLFKLRFTVKVLICIDTFLKCCAKLKLNTWVRPSGFKEPAKGQRDGTSQQTDLTICSLHNLANAQMRSACKFFPHEAHVLSRGWYLLMHSGVTTGMEVNSCLAYADRMCICTCTFASVFSFLVNHRPVQTGRMVNMKIWWAIKRNRWVQELEWHNNLDKYHIFEKHFFGFAFHLQIGYNLWSSQKRFSSKSKVQRSSKLLNFLYNLTWIVSNNCF